MRVRRRTTIGAILGAATLLSCAPRRLSALDRPRAGVVVTPPDAVREEERTKAGVSLSIWHEGPCARLDGTRVLLDGQSLSMETGGRNTAGFLGTKGGQRCELPTFARPTLPTSAMHFVVSDSSATLSMDVDASMVKRAIRVDGELRAGSQAVVHWLPATDGFESYDLPRVSFTPEDGDNGWEVVAAGTSPDIAFTVPSDARPGRGRLKVTARIAVVPTTKCTPPLACRAWLRLPAAGVSTSASVAR